MEDAELVGSKCSTVAASLNDTFNLGYKELFSYFLMTSLEACCCLPSLMTDSGESAQSHD